jgi:hypothetical protein
MPVRCEYCEKYYPECEVGQPSEFKLFCVAGDDCGRRYYCNPFCYIRSGHALAIKHVRWRDLVNFYMTLPYKYPPDIWPELFQEYKSLVQLNEDATMESEMDGWCTSSSDCFCGECFSGFE